MNLIMRLLLVWLLGFPTPALSQDFQEKNEFCYIAQMWIPALLESGQIGGQEICSAGGGSFCSTARNLGQGICLAAGGSFCSTASNLGQGVCLAAGGSFCSTANNLGQGVCLAGGGSFCSTVNELGEGICQASGGSFCSTKSTHEVICDITGSCTGYDAVSLVNSVVAMCGVEVISFGVERY